MARPEPLLPHKKLDSHHSAIILNHHSIPELSSQLATFNQLYLSTASIH